MPNPPHTSIEGTQVWATGYGNYRLDGPHWIRRAFLPHMYMEWTDLDGYWYQAVETHQGRPNIRTRDLNYLEEENTADA